MNTRSTLIRRIVAASVTAAALAAPGAAEAATKPSWCPSQLTSGVAVEFGSTSIIAGKAIANTTAYGYKNPGPRPATMTVSWARSFSETASVTSSVGAEFGIKEVATVKSQLDASVAQTVSRSTGYSQTISVPVGKRAKTWWSIDLRRTTLRYRHYNIGCRLLKTTAWTTVTAPRSTTLKPQIQFVS